MELRTSESVRLAGRDAFDDGAIDQFDLVQRLDVVGDQYLGNNTKETGVSLKAHITHVRAGWR